MSGYDSVNRSVSSRVRKVARDGADVTSGDRQFHTWGPATENARLSYLGFSRSESFLDPCSPLYHSGYWNRFPYRHSRHIIPQNLCVNRRGNRGRDVSQLRLEELSPMFS